MLERNMGHVHTELEYFYCCMHAIHKCNSRNTRLCESGPDLIASICFSVGQDVRVVHLGACMRQAVQSSPLAEMALMKELLAEALESQGCSTTGAVEVSTFPV